MDFDRNDRRLLTGSTGSSTPRRFGAHAAGTTHAAHGSTDDIAGLHAAR